jgi:hypothetical protein
LLEESYLLRHVLLLVSLHVWHIFACISLFFTLSGSGADLKSKVSSGLLPVDAVVEDVLSQLDSNAAALKKGLSADGAAQVDAQVKAAKAKASGLVDAVKSGSADASTALDQVLASVGQAADDIKDAVKVDNVKGAIGKLSG